jgi:Sulfatase
MRFVAAAAAALVLAAVSLTDDAAATRPPVVVLVLDEFPTESLLLPDGRIDRARYPGFGRLAARSTWFPNATTVADSTTHALPAILDGRMPRGGVPPTSAGHPHSLFTLLSRHGYRIHSNEDVTSVCPHRLCGEPRFSWERVFTRLFSGRVERLEATIDSLGRRGPPSFSFHHALLPHMPWSYLPSGRSYRGDDEPFTKGVSGPRGFDDPFLTLQNRQRHLLQVGLVDREVGRLLDRLEAARRLDRALMVVTADHGIAFDLGVRSRRSVSARNIDEIAPVPLFVKRPRQRRGRMSPAWVRTVDVVPTVAALLHLHLPWRVAGRSVFAARRTPRAVGMPDRSLRGKVSIAVRTLRRRRRANLRQMARVYGVGRESLYRIGPHPGLIGRWLDTRTLPTSALRAEIDERRPSFDPASGSVPSWVSGRILGGAASERHDLAVTVNGWVAAVARSFRLRGSADERFSALAPEAAFRKGLNSVELLEVRDGRLLRMDTV